MKNIGFIKLGITLFSTSFLLCGCNDFLNQSPQDTINENIYFKGPVHFELAANYLYSKLGFDYNIINNGDASSDLSNNVSDLYPYGRGQSQIPTSDDVWKKNYENIRAANQLLEKAAIYEGNKEDIKVSVATAHFFRAWHHFLLLRKFGGVPIADKSYQTNSPELHGKRNSRYEVIKFILDDLQEAIEGLPDATTLSTADQGKLSAEAAKSFKARVLLYEGTWDKYVGTKTDGDGTSNGAGSSKPEGYPSVVDMLTEAKKLSKEVIECPAFELWDYRDVLGKDNYYYLFILEDGESNPAGLTKADNKEFIFQTVYDYVHRQIRQNISHSYPVGPSRKMMDMYLCTDGLPVQHSKVFNGYSTMTSEFENRDNRLTSFVMQPLKEYWGHGSATDGGGARWNMSWEEATESTGYDFRYVPILTGPAAMRKVGYSGRKFVTCHYRRETREESMNYPQIRLAEVMLIYAEATCELNGGTISNDDLNFSINKIRKRADVAPLTNELIAPYSDLTMLGEIRRERALELDGEGFRFDDLKRWGIAELELNHNVCINYIQYKETNTEYATALSPKDNKPIYIESAWTSTGLLSEEETVSTYSGIAKTQPGALILDLGGVRQFSLKNYIDPIPSDEIKLNPNLLQNPGW